MATKSTAKKKSTANTSVPELKPVVVRTTSAGVHYGYLVKQDGQQVTLTRSRRIWRWAGANTLSEIATSGLDTEKSSIAAPVDIILTQAIEIIFCTPVAAACLDGAKWNRP